MCVGRAECPTLPCAGDPAFRATTEEEGSGSGSRVILIIVIIILLILIILIIIVLVKKEYREKLFKKFGPKKEIAYVDLEGNEQRNSVGNLRKPPKTVSYAEEQQGEFTDLDLRMQDPARMSPNPSISNRSLDVSDQVEIDPEGGDVQPIVAFKPKAKPRKSKSKESTSLRDSFRKLDRYNAVGNKSQPPDGDHMHEINAEELLEQQREHMRAELKAHKKETLAKAPKEKPPIKSRQSLGGTSNMAFTNDIGDIGEEVSKLDHIKPSVKQTLGASVAHGTPVSNAHQTQGNKLVPETVDNEWNEKHSRQKVPKPVVLPNQIPDPADTFTMTASGSSPLQMPDANDNLIVPPSGKDRRKRHPSHASDKSDRSKRSHTGHREGRRSRQSNGESEIKDKHIPNDSGRESRVSQDSERRRRRRASGESTGSSRSNKPKRPSSRSSRHNDPALINNDVNLGISLTDFTMLDPINEMDGSLV